MKKLLTFVVGAAAVAGAAYWAVKYLTGCENPQDLYPEESPHQGSVPEGEGAAAPDEPPVPAASESSESQENPQT